jgi:hypothetical protein
VVALRRPDNPAVTAAGDIGPDNLRVSDAERDEVLAELRDSFAAGRLSHDTFAHRMEAALSARFRGELGTLRTDLPRPRRLSAAALAAALRALAATDRWLRRYPAALTLPRGKQDRFTIGREPACDMTLTDKTVSRWHACLKREDGGWLLTDLGSTNGTRLNGWRVHAPIAVSPGDLVSFGDATFVLIERPGRSR